MVIAKREIKLKNGKSMSIGSANPTQAGQILEYLKVVGSESDNLLFGSQGLPVTHQQEVEILQRMQEADRVVMLCAQVDGEIASISTIEEISRRSRISHRGGMAISVKKKFWNIGVASAVMQVLLDCAQDCGIEIIELQVRTDNTNAIHLYKKFGFSAIGVYERFMKVDGKYFDALYMQKIF